MTTKDEISKFSIEVENFILRTGYDYVDGIVEYCIGIGLEPELAASLISSNLKAKIEYAANQRNLLKGKGSRLPI
jgi:hypothetical protein